MIFPQVLESLNDNVLKIINSTITIAISTGILYYFGYLLELNNVDRYENKRLFKGLFFVLIFVITPFIGFHILYNLNIFYIFTYII
jgi:hypothetical protein